MCLRLKKKSALKLLDRAACVFAKFFPGNFKTILHFVDLFRVMILKMIFVFEGRKLHKSLDSSTVHLLLNTYFESIYFSTLALLHLYCGYGMLFRSSSRPELLCDSSCSPYASEPIPCLRKYLHETASH